MKLTRTLLAGAILAGMAGAAHAETSVTLYGVVDDAERRRAAWAVSSGSRA